MKPLHLIREGVRRSLLQAGKYDVKISGEMPESSPANPYFVALYPHGEHANSFLFPQAFNLIYLAAHDHFYRNLLNYALAFFTVSTIPIVRRPGENIRASQELASQRIRQAFERSQKVAVYPQGTRSGPTQSPEELQQALVKNRGISLFSSQFQAPIIPVGIVYPDGYNPRKGEPAGGTRILQRLAMKKVDPMMVELKIGQPLLPPSENARKTETQEHMMALASVLWSLVHTRHSQTENSADLHERAFA